MFSDRKLLIMLCTVVEFQAHIGVRGHEAVDRLASCAHDDCKAPSYSTEDPADRLQLDTICSVGAPVLFLPFFAAVTHSLAALAFTPYPKQRARLALMQALQRLHGCVYLPMHVYADLYSRRSCICGLIMWLGKQASTSEGSALI